MPKVSVIIPIYNKEKYLKQCLDSVANQSEGDFEVIMVDDGSTDSSAEIAKGYLTDKRFYYIYQKNSGVSAARNNGIGHATGEWIAFIDSDDSIVEDYIKRLWEETNDYVDIVCCGCQYYKEEKLKRLSFWNGNCIFADEGGVPKKELYLELMNLQHRAISFRETAIGVPWGKLYRTKFLKEKNLQFNLKLHRMQDNIFNMYAMESARAIKYIDEPLYNYNLDHITNYRRKYNVNAPVFIDIVCREREKFLCSKGLLQDAEIYKYFCNEIVQQVDTMLGKFYLNLDNPMTNNQRILAMKQRFSDPIYSEGLKRGYKNISNLIQRIRIKMLIDQKYRILIFFDKLIQKKRKFIK